MTRARAPLGEAAVSGEAATHPCGQLGGAAAGDENEREKDPQYL